MFLLGVLFTVVALITLAVQHRRVEAIIRWATRNAPTKLRPTCGDEVWWEECGYGDCSTNYGTIDALNESKNQFMLEGATTGKDVRDLVWCRYYQNWEYNEGSFIEAHKKQRELERARDASKGWTKCP
jgi:hypothetical protein